MAQMNNITTYAVDHGTDNPSVSANMTLNGGKVVAVAFGDSLTRLDEAEAIVEASMHRLKELDHFFDKEEFIKTTLNEYLAED